MEDCLKRLENENYSHQIQDKAIVLLGFNKADLSTLVSYLNGVPLISQKQGGKWMLTSKYSIKDTILFEKFPIVELSFSNQTDNVTLIKNSYTNQIELEIVNNFYLKQLTKQVREIKFLLLESHEDLLENNGKQFRVGMKKILNYFSLLDFDTKTLYKSVGIIISQVNNEEYEDHEIIEILSLKLSEIVNEERTNFKLNKNEAKMFSKIIANDQVGIFSTPRLSMHTLSQDQSSQIKLILNISMEYIERKELNFNIKFNDYDLNRKNLDLYVNQKLEIFIQNFEKIVIEHFSTKISNLHQMDEALYIYNAILNLNSNRLLTFLDDSLNFKELRLRMEIIDYLNKSLFSLKKTFLLKLNGSVSEFLSNRYEKFLNEVDSLFEKPMFNILKSTDKDLIKKLRSFRNSRETNFDFFIQIFTQLKLLDENQAKTCLMSKKAIDYLIEKLNVNNEKFKRRFWNRESFFENLDELKIFLNASTTTKSIQIGETLGKTTEFSLIHTKRVTDKSGNLNE